MSKTEVPALEEVTLEDFDNIFNLVDRSLEFGSLELGKRELEGNRWI